jgi:hypothetical protein
MSVAEISESIPANRQTQKNHTLLALSISRTIQLDCIPENKAASETDGYFYVYPNTS